MNLAELVDHLIDVGPYDQPHTPDTDDEMPPLPAEEDTENFNTMKPKLHEEE